MWGGFKMDFSYEGNGLDTLFAVKKLYNQAMLQL